MAHGHDGVDEEHARTDVAHHGADRLALRRSVAMDLAFTATRLRLPLRTPLNPGTGILQQIFAFAAEAPIPMSVMLPAKNHNHRLDYGFLFLYTIHNAKLTIFPEFENILPHLFVEH